MNYYIDFDNTLYETANLTKKMIGAVANLIANNKKLEYNNVLEDITPKFNSSVDNIFSFAEKMANSYDTDAKSAIDSVNEVINSGADLVFADAKKFLEAKKKSGDKLIILTYVADGNQEYQLQKIMGSGIAKYFEQIIITTKYKFELDLNYENGIFIDDDPRDLNGLYEKIQLRL